MLGQYFTENEELQKQIFELCYNQGNLLEPSSGKGDLVRFFEIQSVSDIISIEIDNKLHIISDITPLYMDFFDYSLEYKYDTIFGNPPFVKQNEILREMKLKVEKKSLLKNCNLFYYFIEKSFYHLKKRGEIIFIVPKEFVNSTRAVKLRELLYNNGTITDIIDYEEGRFFKDAAPNIIIIRYEKNNDSHITRYVKGSNISYKKEIFYNGSFLYIDKKICPYKRFGDVFDVKVGLVSGLNEVFEKNSKFSIPMICSDYIKTKKKRNFIFADEFFIHEVKKRDYELYKYLLEHKNLLLNRKIKKFNEDDWFHYGAVRNIGYMRKKGKCIYVNTKTRCSKPFFVDEISYFDGSLLGLFEKDQINWIFRGNKMDIYEWCSLLNNSKHRFMAQNMYVNNKFIFTVKSLLDFNLE